MQGGPPNASGAVIFSGCHAVSERLGKVFEQRREAEEFVMRKCWGQGEGTLRQCGAARGDLRNYRSDHQRRRGRARESK
jgi:hypothetical protein